MRRTFTHAGLAAAGFALALNTTASANPAIVVDVATGETLYQQEATRPWYPASLSKLMTVFVALKAMREGRITGDTPIRVSALAARQAPSKMGFRPGTLVTLDNALKMLMVKSANDLAVAIAEGVAGSVDAFATEMNETAASIGMRESHFVNPNGLPDSRQISSARDMAVLARALYAYFPEKAGLFDIGALKLGKKVIRNHNGMLGRYPGADGMKTGFTCAAGFNLVASATMGGRRLITVVLGAPSTKSRTMLAASLFDRGFSGSLGAAGPALSLASMGGDPPDMHDSACRNRKNSEAQFEAEVEDLSVPIPSTITQTHGPEGQSIYGSAPAAAGAAATGMRPSEIATLPRPEFQPTPVFVGPVAGWTGPIAHATGDSGPVTKQAYAGDKDAADSPLKPAPDAQSMRRKRGGRHGHVARGKAVSAKAAKAKAVKPKAAKTQPAKAKKHADARTPKQDK